MNDGTITTPARTQVDEARDRLARDAAAVPTGPVDSDVTEDAKADASGPEPDPNAPAPEPKLTDAQLAGLRGQQLDVVVGNLRSFVGRFHAMRCVAGDISAEAIMPFVSRDLAGVEQQVNSIVPPPADLRRALEARLDQLGINLPETMPAKEAA